MVTLTPIFCFADQSSLRGHIHRPFIILKTRYRTKKQLAVALGCYSPVGRG